MTLGQPKLLQGPSGISLYQDKMENGQLAFVISFALHDNELQAPKVIAPGVQVRTHIHIIVPLPFLIMVQRTHTHTHIRMHAQKQSHTHLTCTAY